jgi:hypothetical protein
MKNKLLLSGIKSGIESMGGQLSNVDDNFFYVTIIKGSELDNEVKIQRMKGLIQRTFSGYGLKIKKVDSLLKK